MEIKELSKNLYEIPKKNNMNVAARLFISPKILKEIKKDKTLEQSKNIACLPGILKYSIAMADAHQGYGFPIGGVAAFDSKKGIVTPAGIGYDINCGVRLIKTNIKKEGFEKLKEKVLDNIFREIPSGVGEGSKEKLSGEELLQILTKGSKYLVDRGQGKKSDYLKTEEKGAITGADPKKISQRAFARGMQQLGSLGAGNHFLEIGYVEEIFDKKIAEKFGLKKDRITILIHCGSRGLGHQIIRDYISKMEKEYGTEYLPDKELVYAPIKSSLGQDCLSAMACAVNFAFANRQMITHKTRKILEKFFPESKPEVVYDVCHNIAKFEKHEIKGKEKEVLIHRKGATRSFGPGRTEIPFVYRKTGQPVIIPGSMGTASYVLVGTKKAEELTFGSTVHGSGRLKSRGDAIKSFIEKDTEKELSTKGIFVKSKSKKRLAEENPLAYKDVEEVVNVVHELGISQKVARLKPLVVVK